jgi:hypothetical protein
MITGKLVGLRAIEKSDLALLRDWRNNPKFRKNFREIRELSMSNQEAWFERIVLGSRDDFMFIIVRLEDNTPIGVCGLTYINWIIRSADFSFYIGHEAKYIDNDGYAEEAAKLLIDYGFNILNLHKIWTELYEFDNIKISFLTGKLGFHKDGVLVDNCFEGGKYWNSYIVSILAKEFRDK